MLATAIRTAANPQRVSAIPIGRREMTTALAALERIGLVLSLERDATVFFEGGDAKSYFKVSRGIIRNCRLLSDGRRFISDLYLFTQLRSRRLIRVQDSHDVILVNRGAIEDLANAA